MTIQPAFARSAPPGSTVRVPSPAPSGSVEAVQVDLRAEAPPEEGPSLGTAARLGLVALAVAGVAGLAGCDPAPSTPAPPSVCKAVPAQAGNQAAAALEAQSAAGSMEFQVVPEGLGRVDLLRQTETKTSRDLDGHRTTRQEDVPHSPFGVYLGEGLFHDTNGNLSLVPALAFPDFAPAGSSTVCFDGPWGLDYQVSPQAGAVRLDGPWGADFDVTRQGELTRIDGPAGADHAIVKSGDTVQVDGPWGRDYTLTRTGDTIRSNWPWNDDYTITRTGETTRVDGPWSRDFTIRREGNRIIVDGPWGNDTTLTRDGDRIVVDGPSARDYTLRREGDTLRIEGRWIDKSTTTYGR